MTSAEKLAAAETVIQLYTTAASQSAEKRAGIWGMLAKAAIPAARQLFGRAAKSPLGQRLERAGMVVAQSYAKELRASKLREFIMSKFRGAGGAAANAAGEAGAVTPPPIPKPSGPTPISFPGLGTKPPPAPSSLGDEATGALVPR